MLFRNIQFIIILLAVPFVGLLLFAQSENTSIFNVFSPKDPILLIDGNPFSVEVVDTPALRTRGLSGRSELGHLDGMLFVFEESAYPGIWMKDMLFPIDIIWINENLTVVEVTEHVQPDTYPEIFEPPEPVRYVLETRNFFAETYNIRPGQKVVLPEELTEK